MRKYPTVQPNPLSFTRCEMFMSYIAWFTYSYPFSTTVDIKMFVINRVVCGISYLKTLVNVTVYKSQDACKTHTERIKSEQCFLIPCGILIALDNYSGLAVPRLILYKVWYRLNRFILLSG